MGRRLLSSVSLTLACLLVCNSQLAFSQAPPPPKLSSSVELVTVPVVVRRSGAHVAGLKKENFTLLEDGTTREIATFEEVHSTDAINIAPNSAESFSNLDPSIASERLFVIAVDLVNTPQLDKAYLKQEIVKFLDGAEHRGESLALIAITDSGIHVLQDFTTNRALLSAAVDKSGNGIKTRQAGLTGSVFLDSTPCSLSAGGCGGSSQVASGIKQLGDWESLYKVAENYDIFLDRTSRMSTLGALQQIAQWLGGFPGRKTLVWAGDGIPVLGGMNRVMNGSRVGSYSTMDLQNVGQAMDENVYTFRILSAANVAVYPLDARHGANTSFAMYDVSRSDAPIGDQGFAGQKGRVQNDDRERIEMFQQIAGATGGKPCFNRTDLANCLKEFSAESNDYYMLGFYVSKKTKTGWHKLAVKLDQKADLRSREGYNFSPPAPDKTRQSDLQLAMVSPLPYTLLPISGRFTQIEGNGAKKSAHFELKIPPQAMGLGDAGDNLNFDVVAVARGTDGKEVTKIAQRIQKKLQPQQSELIRSEGIFYTNKIELPKGTYGIWFVVRDNTVGTTGSVRTVLTIP